MPCSCVCACGLGCARKQHADGQAKSCFLLQETDTWLNLLQNAQCPTRICPSVVHSGLCFHLACSHCISRHAAPCRIEICRQAFRFCAHKVAIPATACVGSVLRLTSALPGSTRHSARPHSLLSPNGPPSPAAMQYLESFSLRTFQTHGRS